VGHHGLCIVERKLNCTADCLCCSYWVTSFWRLSCSSSNLQQVSTSVLELSRAFRSFSSNTRCASIAELRFFPSTCTCPGSPISQLPAGPCIINICSNKLRISACFSSILWSGFIYLKCRLKLQEFGLCQGELSRFDLESFFMFHHLYL
jgi:hypothetical protein